ncbi:host cell division inhibitor Icd-like protein [Escherichia coli]
MCWWVKTKSAPLPERPCEQLTYCAKNESVRGDYINRGRNDHSCRITGKTKATRYGGPLTQATRYPQRMSITNNATFTAGGQILSCSVITETTALSRLGYDQLFFNSISQARRNISPSLLPQRFFFSKHDFKIKAATIRTIAQSAQFLSFGIFYSYGCRRDSSHHGADSDYSDSLALRRWSSSRATATSCPISSAALTPIFSTCASASSEETRGFSPLPSAWRRAISPRMAVTMNPALLSPSSFTDSMPSITSWGTLTVVNCDLAFLLVVAITETPQIWCVSVYTKKKYKKGLTCVSLQNNMKHTNGFIEIQTTKPGSALTLTGLLTTNDSKIIEVAMLNHTTHPQGRDLHNLNKYIWRFIALSTAQPRVITIEATSEQEARQQSPAGCVMVFAARIRQEVRHVQ